MTGVRRSSFRLATIVVGLAVTGLFVLAASTWFPPRYEATASVVVLPGPGNIPERANPFLFLGGVSQARDILVKLANSDEVRAELLSESSDLDYAVGVDVSGSAPMLAVSASARDPQSALSMRDAVLDYLPRELEALQDKAATPPGSRIESLVLVEDPDATRVDKGRVRGLVAVAILGLGLTFVAVAAIDLLSRRHGGSPAVRLETDTTEAGAAGPGAEDRLTPSRPREANRASGAPIESSPEVHQVAEGAHST